MDEEQRQRVMGAAVQDKETALYQGLCKVLFDCEAADQRSREIRPYVVVPFFLEDADVVSLEAQFDVKIKVKSGGIRAPLTSRVNGMVFLLEHALLEHAGSCGRRVLLIDGDVMSVAALGIEGRLVERTNATSRLATSYFFEDEHLKRFTSSRSGVVNVVADLLLREQYEGGGDHFWPCVRAHGPKVDAIVVNHFKTPVGPRQLAWLAFKRGGIVFGAVPFQFEMLTSDRGSLECFPGEFYIDRESDVITLIPHADATMSISHPYSSWLEIVTNNVITVDGREFLCEKYKSLNGYGVMYYTLKAVGDDYEVPEVLRSHYYDAATSRVTELHYPKVRLSAEGVPVGMERGVARILTSRCDRVLSRLMTNPNAIVTPVDAFVALMDYNNTVLTSLDTVKLSERMEFEEENAVALALALHVNWTRHAAKGTFNVLLDAIKLRHSLKDMALYRFAFVALSAWWSKPRVDDMDVEDELPAVKVVDWCGNDFSVIMKDADPWIEIIQTAGVAVETSGREYPWFPKPPVTTSKGWYEALLAKAKGALKNQVEKERVEVKKPKMVTRSRLSFVSEAKPVVGAVTVDEYELKIEKAVPDLTSLKTMLLKKMVVDQGAVNEPLTSRLTSVYAVPKISVIPRMPVPDVDPYSSILDDITMLNRGPFTRDVVTTGYRIAELDVDKVTEGNFSVNDAKRAIPAARWVRRPKVDAGVEGKRVSSQAALMGALFKRNIGVPSNRGSVDLDAMPKQAIDKVIQVCFREDWQEVLTRHLENGLWEPNLVDIEDYLANLDEKKTKGLLEEFFQEGIVNLQRWMLMAKGKIKPSRESNSDMKVDHSQTIMYLEQGSTNAMYSAMTRRFKECLDDCLRSEVSLNSQRSDEEHEDWYNSLEPVRQSHGKTYSYAADIRIYDRSQEHVGLRVELELYRRLGLDERRLEIWSQTHGPKKAVAMMFGVVLTMVLGGVSGLWKTLLRNGIINLAAVVVSTSISRKDLVMLDIKGDDLDAEFSRQIRVESSVERMSLTFNLSAKFFTSDVRYMCKAFRMKCHGRWIHVADPWARVQSVCTPLWIGNCEDDLSERWISLCNDLRHYDNGLLVDMVAEAAQQYYGCERPLYGLARALAVFKSSKYKYVSFFKAPEMVS